MRLRLASQLTTFQRLAFRYQQAHFLSGDGRHHSCHPALRDPAAEIATRAGQAAQDPVFRRVQHGARVDSVVGMSAPKRFVYILKSLAKPDTYYVGLTSNVRRRLEAHNEGLSAHTSEHRPWRTLVVIEFDEEAPALEFERYLKTGSGREFARRHFRQMVRAHGAREL